MTTIPSRDGTQIHEQTWMPAQAATATVVIVHGYGEHIGRYDRLARELNQAGLAVAGCDLRGHGRSAGQRGYVAHFDEYFADVGATLERAQKRHPGPTVLLGHSLGGLIAFLFALREPTGLAGLVLSSPYFQLKLKVPRAKELAGKIFSSLVPRLALPSELKGSDVTRDPEVARAYDNDPLTHKKATARWFTEANAAQELAFQRAPDCRLPCLVMHGGSDKVAEPDRTAALFERIGSADKTLRVYPAMYHEIFNEIETDRAKVVEELLGWLTSHLAGAGAMLRAGTP